MPNSLPTRIGIAVVEHDDRFLVGVRGPDGPLPGKAEFPGGKCRPGETPRDCAARECREETDLAVTPVTLLQQLTHTYPHGPVELHFWHCHPENESEIAETHQTFRWVSREELATLPFPEANADVVAMLVANFISVDISPELSDIPGGVWFVYYEIGKSRALNLHAVCGSQFVPDKNRDWFGPLFFVGEHQEKYFDSRNLIVPSLLAEWESSGNGVWSESLRVKEMNISALVMWLREKFS